MVYRDLETADLDRSDVDYIADNLRPADAAEVHATSGHADFRAILRRSVAFSDDVVVWYNAYGEPVGVQGVGTLSLLYNTGCPWLLGTPRLNEHLRAYIAIGRSYTDQMLAQYAHLTNHVDARNTKSVAWLQRLGFVMEAPVPYGALGLPFHRFHTERT